MKNEVIDSAKKKRLEFQAEGDKLYLEGNKIEARKLWEKANLILAEAILVWTKERLLIEKEKNKKGGEMKRILIFVGLVTFILFSCLLIYKWYDNLAETGNTSSEKVIPGFQIEWLINADDGDIVCIPYSELEKIKEETEEIRKLIKQGRGK